MGESTVGRRAFLGGALAGAAFGGGMAMGGEAPAGAGRASPLEGKRILIATGEFGESLETYYMLFRLREEGAEGMIGAPRKKKVQLVVHDFEPGYDAYTEKPGYFIEADVAYADVKPDGFDGLLIPGGRAPEEIRQDRHLVAIVKHFMESGKPVGAMCHGVMLIYTAVPIRGRTLTAYSGIRADIELLGGTFVDQEVVVDRSLVTSRGWPDLPAFLRAYLRLLRRRRA